MVDNTNAPLLCRVSAAQWIPHQGCIVFDSALFEARSGLVNHTRFT